MNGNELTFYWRLRDALPNHIVLAQVPLAAFIRLTTPKATSYFNQFDRLRADFIICDSGARVLAVIEIDGKSHDSLKQQKRDAIKAAVLRDAGIKLHRLNSRQLPETTSIKGLLAL